MHYEQELQTLRPLIEDYLMQRGLSLRRPFCCLNPAHPDRNPSMSYNKKAYNVHCFACGATFDLFDLVGMDYNLESFLEQKNKAAELFSYSGSSMPASLPKAMEGILETENSHARALPNRQEELDVLLAEATGENGYFRERGITQESCIRFGLFERGGRAYFPLFEQGVCTGWCARAISDKLPLRYQNAPGQMGIFNVDILLEACGDADVFVTEGIIDAIVLCQMGYAALSVCGVGNWRKLLQKIEDRRKLLADTRFILCGDPDEAGQLMNEKLSENLLQLGLRCSVLALESFDGDVAALYVKDRERLSKLTAAAVDASVPSVASERVAQELEGFFAERDKRAARGAVPTGFSGLDRVLDGGLYPGLYILGGISSLGKTSFVLQLADYIASTGRDVLFVSIEQSKYELMSKSLSRHTAQAQKPPYSKALTARQILSHAITGQREQALLDGAVASYRGVLSSLYFMEGITGISTGQLAEEMGRHRREQGKTPVLVIDYLQILSPADARSTDKQNTDRAVIHLKGISRDFDTPVIAVSSFNRENYRAAVSMEAFKESGALEYSSDVLLGLQLAGAGSKDFDANRLKKREPRPVELVILKNRNGIPYAKIPFQYHAKFSLFSEGERK